MEEKNIDGLIIKYNKLSITHKEPILSFGNRGNIANNVYPINGKFRDVDTQHSAILDLWINVVDVDLEIPENILIEFKAEFFIDRENEKINPKKDLFTLTDFSLSLIQEYVNDNLVKDKQGQLLEVPALTALNFDEWLFPYPKSE